MSLKYAQTHMILMDQYRSPEKYFQAIELSLKVSFSLTLRGSSIHLTQEDSGR